MFKSRSLSKKIGGQGMKNVIGQTFPANFLKFVLIFYGLLKMSQGQQLLDPDLELINVKSLDFVKPKLFFKKIRGYLDLQSCPDSVQLLPDLGHKEHYRTALQHLTGQT
jgi:hypothetical protein